MRVISEKDIESAIDFQELLVTVEKAFLLQEENNFYMPDRSHINYRDNALLLMPCFREEVFSTKLVSVFPKNKKQHKPSIYGSVLLNSGITGEPLALINGSKLTALRTGAVGAIGILYTTSIKANSLGLFGAGVQGFHQLIFAATVRNIERVGVFDPHNKKIAGFIKQLSDLLPHIKFSIYTDALQLLNQSEIIISATTSEVPVIPNDLASTEGKHFIGVGSYKPSMREMSVSVFNNLDQIFIDTPLAIKESGDLVYPLKENLIQGSQVIRLGKLINKSISLSDNKTTFFKSVGMALFDLEVANLIYKNCIKQGIGTEVEF
jgi:ornithine cyclodeaminase